MALTILTFMPQNQFLMIIYSDLDLDDQAQPAFSPPLSTTWLRSLYVYYQGWPDLPWGFYIKHRHWCKSHDRAHQWTHLVMTWLPWDKRKREHIVVRLAWEFDCLHFAQYIWISPHGIGCKQTWSKKIYRMNRATWLNTLLGWSYAWQYQGCNLS